MDAAATATGSDQLGQIAAAEQQHQQQQFLKDPAGLKRLDSETASAAEDAAAATDTSRQRQPPLAPLQLQGDAMEVDGGAAAAAEQLCEQDMQQHGAMAPDYDMQQEDEEDEYEEKQQRSSARKQRRLECSTSGNSSLADANPSRRSGRQAAAAEAAAAAAATAAAVAAASHTPPRRSGREAKKRVVYVDGMPVLRDNLYGEEGEPSVWEKELAGEQRSCTSYHTVVLHNVIHSCSIAVGYVSRAQSCVQQTWRASAAVDFFETQATSAKHTLQPTQLCCCSRKSLLTCSCRPALHRAGLPYILAAVTRSSTQAAAAGASAAGAQAEAGGA
jgi:hypothetical protein